MAEAASLISANKYHAIIVPAEGGAPQVTSSDDMKALMATAFQAMLQVQSGWAYFVLEGKLCVPSHTKQSFKVQLPDGTTLDVNDPTGYTYDPSGKFETLRPISK